MQWEGVHSGRMGTDTGRSPAAQAVLRTGVDTVWGKATLIKSRSSSSGQACILPHSGQGAGKRAKNPGEILSQDRDFPCFRLAPKITRKPGGGEAGGRRRSGERTVRGQT